MKGEIDITSFTKAVQARFKKLWYILIALVLIGGFLSHRLYKQQQKLYSTEAIIYLGASEIEPIVVKQFLDLLSRNATDENYNVITNLLSIDIALARNIKGVRAEYVENENKSINVELIVLTNEGIDIIEEALLSTLNSNKVINELKTFKLERFKHQLKALGNEIYRVDSLWGNKTPQKSIDYATLAEVSYSLQESKVTIEYFITRLNLGIEYFVSFNKENLTKLEETSLKVYLLAAVFLSFVLMLAFVFVIELWKVIK